MFQKEVFLIKKLACKLKVDSSLHIMIEIIFCQAAPVLTPVHNIPFRELSPSPSAGWSVVIYEGFALCFVLIAPLRIKGGQR